MIRHYPLAMVLIAVPFIGQVPDPPRVHDPVMAKEGKDYYVFSTGRGIEMLRSRDRVTWERLGPVLNPVPAWTATTIPGSRDFYWAPDISRFNGRWHLYYSVSTFGKNRSAIGLATNRTLDPTRKDYAWRDEGIVVESQPADDWNAIDPNVTFDQRGRPWLSLGSFWSGLKLFPLDRRTGKLAKPGEPPVSVASRPAPGAIEAPFIYRRGRWFYLFASFDLCCRGANSTYNIRVGRARKVEGPYLDRDGKPMTEGGGTLILEGAGRWKGPGHQAVFRDGRDDLLVYHAYDAEDRGASKLQIAKLAWDRDGWPTVSR